MMMFLTLAFASLASIAICSMLFARLALTPDRRQEARPETEAETAERRMRFFASQAAAGLAPSGIPREFLLSQIERHVRSEQAAVQAFLEVPTPDALYSRSASPFSN